MGDYFRNDKTLRLVSSWVALTGSWHEEDTLLSGYRLAVLQSLRVSRRTSAAQHPGRAPSHHTL